MGRALVTPLRLVRTATPSFPKAGYRTKGTYPQVSGAQLDLRTVNSILRAAVLADEQRFANRASSRPPAPANSGLGLYATSVNLKLLSASTVVVSALVPVSRLYPGGTDGQDWIAVTVDVKRGTRVALPKLFSNWVRALPALARFTREQLMSNTCVKAALDDAIAGPIFARGFAPIAVNYRDFALTAKGLAIGFPVGKVAFPTCNRVSVIVEYGQLRPYLSPLGRHLISGIRAPLR